MKYKLFMIINGAWHGEDNPSFLQIISGRKCKFMQSASPNDLVCRYLC
jgi:hypothetical protein